MIRSLGSFITPPCQHPSPLACLDQDQIQRIAAACRTSGPTSTYRGLQKLYRIDVFHPIQMPRKKNMRMEGFLRREPKFIEISFITHLKPIVMQNAPTAVSISCGSNRWPWFLQENLASRKQILERRRQRNCRCAYQTKATLCEDTGSCKESGKIGVKHTGQKADRKSLQRGHCCCDLPLLV